MPKKQPTPKPLPELSYPRRPGRLEMAVAVVLGATMLLVIAFSLPKLFTQDSNLPQSTCMSNLKETALAVVMYDADFDHSLPPSPTWADATLPYAKDKSGYACPDVVGDIDSEVHGAVSPSAPDEFGHAFRSSLGLRRVSSVRDQEKQALVFDSIDLAWNANGALALLPAEGRHKEGVNGIAFLDGHAGYLERPQIAALPREVAKL